MDEILTILIHMASWKSEAIGSLISLKKASLLGRYVFILFKN